jgi:hypothetical protein
MPKTNLIPTAKVSKVKLEEGSKRVGTSLQIYDMLKKKKQVSQGEGLVRVRVDLK